MNRRPDYADLIGVMAQAAMGDATARVAVSEEPAAEDEISSLALALNMLLDDMDLKSRELRNSYAEIQAQHAAIRRLWTPILTVAERVLLIPLIGWIDVERSQQMLETALTQIHRVGARALIIDLTAVPEIDAQGALALGRLTSATKLLGAEVVIAGISAAVAQSMTLAGIDLRNLCTKANLAQAISSFSVKPV